MERKARVALEFAVNQLESQTQGDPREWVDASAEQLTDEQKILYLQVIVASLHGLFSGVCKTIYGTNILTPALTHKGWAFWRKLPVTSEEKVAIGEAAFKVETCMQEVARLTGELASRQDSEPEEVVAVVANLCSCLRQFSNDLRDVLDSSHGPGDAP
jgi:hypothetical protein